MGFIFNFIKKILKLSIKFSLYLAIFATIILVIPNLPPYAKFTKIDITPTQERVGPLAPNDALNNVAKTYKGKLLGPEAFQLLNGELYTSLATGEIVKVSPGGHVTFVTKVGQPCSGLSKEHICGRPLGFQIDDQGKSLYLADAYHGIWKVDLKTDKKQLLVSPRVVIGKRLPKLFNSIALDKNGDFYWTDSSSDFQLKDGAISILADPSGRLFHYNAAKNQSKVLADDLWFPNGIVLSPNNEFLVISESCGYRLMKYYVAGPKKGKSEVFVDGLPGAPDNVRVLPDGSGILVGLYSVFDDDHPMLVRSMSSTPLVRKFLARLQRLVEIPFEYLNTLYPHVMFEDIVYYIGHFKSVSGLTPGMSGLLQVDWNGNIVASYYNTDGSLKHISDAVVFNGNLLLGAAHEQDFIGSVSAPPLLKQAFESAKKAGAPKIEKVKVETPKSAPPPPKTTSPPPPKTTTPPPPPKTTTPPPKTTTPPPPPKTTTPPPPPKTTTPPPPPKTTTPPPPPKTTTPPPKTTTPPPPPKTTTPPPPPKTTTPPPPKQTTTPPPPKPTTPPPPKTTPPPPKTTTTPPPKQTTTTPKPETKTPPPPKPVEQKVKNEQPKKAQKPGKQEPPKVKEQIPITEEIPSDTAKPPKETLKVIKKGGPAEIPVRNEL